MKVIRLMPEKARLEERNCFLLADVQSWLFPKMIWEVVAFWAPQDLSQTHEYQFLLIPRGHTRSKILIHYLGKKSIWLSCTNLSSQFTAVSSPSLGSLHLLFQFSPVWCILYPLSSIRHLRLKVFHANKKGQASSFAYIW